MAKQPQSISVIDTLDESVPVQDTLIFGAPTATAEPNDVNASEIVSVSDTLGVSSDYTERNIEQFKRPTITAFGSQHQFTFPSGNPNNFMANAVEAGRQSIRRVNADQAIADAYLSKKDITKLLGDRKSLESEEVIEGDNFFSDTLYKGIAVAAPMAQSIAEASPFAAMTMLGGAILGGIAGNLFGGGLAPEELITVPAGAKAGLSVGTMFGLKAGITEKSAEYWYRQGTGQMIYSMTQNGVDLEVAGPIAAIAAIPYAAIEFAQMHHLTPGLRKGIQDIGMRSMLQAFTAAAKKYGETYVIENFEEVLQEGVMIAAEDIAEFFDSEQIAVRPPITVPVAGGPRLRAPTVPPVKRFNKEAYIQRANRLARTATESAQSLLLLPLPGAAVDVRSGAIQVKNRNNLIGAIENQIKVPRDAAELAVDMLDEGRSVAEVDQMLSQAKFGVEPAETVEGEIEAQPTVQPTEGVTPLQKLEEQAKEFDFVPFEGIDTSTIAELQARARAALNNPVKSGKVTTGEFGGEEVYAGVRGDLEHTSVVINDELLEKSTIEEVLNAQEFEVPRELIPDKATLRKLLIEHEREHVKLMQEGAQYPDAFEEKLVTARALDNLGLVEPTVQPTEGVVDLQTTDKGKFVEIDSIEATPTGTGAGTQALNELIESTDKPIRLTVGRTNTRARDLYERLGFIEITPEDPKITGIRMEKPPTPPEATPKSVIKETETQRDILGGVDPLVQIHKALSDAKAIRPKTVAEQKAERRKRVGAAAGAKETGVKKAVQEGTPVEQAILRSTGLLKGPLTEYDQLYESIEESLEPEVKNAAYLQIDQHPDLRYFEVVSTTKAFQKLLAGSSITPNEVQMIEKVFGKQFEEATDKQGEKSGLYDRLITLWKAGLLTGIKTSGLNMLSTAGHAVSETAKAVPEAFIDTGLSLVTGERTTAFTVKGFKTGFRQGLDKGWKYLKTGHDQRDVGKKYDYKKTNFGTSKTAKALQAYTDFVFHLLGAEDQPWYYGAFSKSLYSQSIAQGKNKGLKGKELDAFVENLQAHPTDDMLLWAKEDAETAIYTNRTNLGDLGRAIQKVKPGEIIAPFTRTPSAVAMQIINYSPVGIVKEIGHQVHTGEFSQRNISQAGGRSVIGTGTLWLGTQLFKQGLINLGFPKNERERKLWELEGRKPNSIKVGGKWRDVQALGPTGNLLVIGGYFQQALDSKGSPSEAMIEAMAGGAKSFTEQTFVRGVNLAVDALTDPEASFDRWFTSMAGSVVPTLVADIARAQDDKSRLAVGPKERIQSRLPVYRENLPPKIDVFGQDLPRYGGNVLETMIDPTRPSKIRQDVVVDELRRLSDKNIKVSPTLLGDKAGYDILTREENTQLWHRAGELTYKSLFKLMQGEKYRNAGKDIDVDPDFVKGQLIDGMISDAKALAKLELVKIKIGQGKTIMELAESGLYGIKEFEMLKFYRDNE